jgi:hypothetical protein
LGGNESDEKMLVKKRPSSFWRDENIYTIPTSRVPLQSDLPRVNGVNYTYSQPPRAF